jgi:hypothetical protein
MIQVEIEQLAATLAVIAVEPFDPHPLSKDATSFEEPFETVSSIKDQLAFYVDRVDSIDEHAAP